MSIQILVDAGWDVSIYRQKKRDDGIFKELIQWRAKQFSGLKEYTNESKGFDTCDEAIADMWNTLTKL
jgi:hypothetical protein